MGRQYVIGVRDGKPTGFTAFYNEQNQEWEISEAKSRARKKSE